VGLLAQPGGKGGGDAGGGGGCEGDFVTGVTCV
jgi:hypothetical protein